MLDEFNKPYLTTAEAARFLGTSKDAIYTRIHRGAIPYYKPSGPGRASRVYLKKDDLIAWIEKGRVMSDAELDAQAEEFARTGGIS